MIKNPSLRRLGLLLLLVFYIVPGPYAHAQSTATDQLELGQAFERLDRLKEAEDAYAKAAQSDWPPTRKTALDALTRVIDKEESRSDKYFWSPFIISTTALVTAII